MIEIDAPYDAALLVALLPRLARGELARLPVALATVTWVAAVQKVLPVRVCEKGGFVFIKHFF